MRIALISDIHGNIVAFEAVLKDITRQGVDQIVFLGDALDMGPRPVEVLERLKGLSCPCIMGNHETFLLNVDHLCEDGHGEWFIELAEWCVAQLSAADIEFLRGFQPTLTVELGPETALLCFHGSPKSNQDFILSSSTEAELGDWFSGQSATVLAGGHSHVQLIRRYKGAMYMNVGSVGYALAHFPFDPPPPALPWAEYGIVSYTGEILSLDLRQVPFDLEAARRSVLESSMPNKENWLPW